jgi:hypothetical protein
VAHKDTIITDKIRAILSDALSIDVKGYRLLKLGSKDTICIYNSSEAATYQEDELAIERRPSISVVIYAYGDDEEVLESGELSVIDKINDYREQIEAALFVDKTMDVAVQTLSQEVEWLRYAGQNIAEPDQNAEQTCLVCEMQFIALYNDSLSERYDGS